MAVGSNCLVQRIYDGADYGDQLVLRAMLRNPSYTGGMLAKILAKYADTPVDHMAVDHFRRKMRAGKARL